MTSVEEALGGIAALGTAESVDWALIGGLAVSVRVEPRFTRDVDLAVSVADDEEAERLISGFVVNGYAPEAIVEQEALGRMATVRLRNQSKDESPFVDLLFASSGIEDLIVASAEPLEVLEDVVLPVATTEHLLATKVLAAQPDRPQDQVDAVALAGALDSSGIEVTRDALREIERRGFNRGRDLLAALESVLEGAIRDFPGS